MTEQKNRFDEKYEIRLARTEDIPGIMEYIDEDWKKGHIMATNRELFEHEFCTQQNGSVNMMLAIKKENQRIEGFLGFLPASMTEPNPDIWGSFWKIRKGNMMFLGNEIMRRLLAEVPHRYYGAVGVNRNTSAQITSKIMSQQIKRMKHWYILNDQMETYNIAAIMERKMNPAATHPEIRIEICKDFSCLEQCFDFEAYKERTPYKDGKYIERRYFSYPLYQYSVYKIMEKEMCKAFFCLREVACKKSKAIRLIDFYGDNRYISLIGGFLKQMLVDGAYEYVDFYEHGFDEEEILKAGFVERTEQDENIIPNFFSPFVQENIEIYVEIPLQDYVCCKGDGDQDRPN